MSKINKNAVDPIELHEVWQIKRILEREEMEVPPQNKDSDETLNDYRLRLIEVYYTCTQHMYCTCTDIHTQTCMLRERRDNIKRTCHRLQYSQVIAIEIHQGLHKTLLL